MISIQLVVAVLVLILTWLLLFYYKQNRDLPPGPKGLPFFGYYPFLSSQHYRDFANLAKRYGKVFSFRTVGGNIIIVLNGVDIIKEILINRADEFIGRTDKSNLIPWISDGFGILQEEGLVWKKQRHFFIQALRKLGLENQETELSIQKKIRTMIKDVHDAKSLPLDFTLHVAYAVNSVIFPVLFSKRYEKYSKEFKDVVDESQQLVEIFGDKKYLIVGWIYKYVIMNLFPSTKMSRKAKRSFKEIAKAIVDEHIKTFDPEYIRDYVDCYLYEAYKLEKKAGNKEHDFTRDRLIGIVLNMLMEGTETVTVTICSMLEIISKHLTEQKMVQEELDSVIGQERLPCWADRYQMPYFNAFLQELYRVGMPFKISTFYSNFEETAIHGYRIPKRSLILVNFWAMNNDPELYPEPSRFDPGRFLDQNKTKAKQNAPCLFGVGKRTCIVESLAEKEIFMIIASILQNFTLHQTCDSGLIIAESRENARDACTRF